MKKRKRKLPWFCQYQHIKFLNDFLEAHGTQEIFGINEIFFKKFSCLGKKKCNQIVEYWLAKERNEAERKSNKMDNRGHKTSRKNETGIPNPSIQW